MIRIQRRPEVDVQEILGAMRQYFDLDGTLSPLPGERDQNYLLETDDGRRYVVKVSSPEEPDPILRFETEMLVKLAAETEGLLPGVHPAKSGENLVEFEDAQGKSHRMRVVDFLPGTLLAKARPRTEELLYDFGRRVAELVSALGGYPDHPPARFDFDWALGSAGSVMERCLHLFDGEQRDLIESVHRSFDERGHDFLGLGSQIIHGDINDHNVLVSDPDGTRRYVTGFIDFGDAHSAPRVFDLAIAMAYATLGTSDPVTAAATIVRGFNDATPLLEAEIDVIFTLARARLGQSVSVAAWKRSQGEAIDDSHFVSEAPAWDLLRRLDGLSDKFLRGVLRDACGQSANVRTPYLMEWLAKQECEPVIDIPDEEGALVVLDLAVDSPYVDGHDTDDTPLFQKRISRMIADAGASIGVGRYLEPRAFYLTDAFAGREGDPRERRTVHLGIDLFTHEGTDIRAPLAGKVRAIENNSARLDYGPTVVLEHPSPHGRFWTLYGHLSMESIDSLEIGREIRAGEQFARLGGPPENGDWPPHLHFQIVTHFLGYGGDFPGVALPRERSVWASFSPDPNVILGLPVDATYQEPEELAERRSRALPANLSLSYASPIHVVRGRGTRLFDPLGRAYLDCVNNVAHVGHEHPDVVRAGQRQMAVLNTDTRYLHEKVVEYAERLAALLPDPLSCCFFVNSGSEANELALRMARAHTNGSGVVALEGGYHGHTQTLIDVSHYKFASPGGMGAPPWVRTAPAPDEYRGRYGRNVADRAARYAGHVKDALADLRGASITPSAFIAETFLSCGGQIEPPHGYLAASYAHVRASGAVCIADEIQTGFGRIGSDFWSFESQDVVPDIVTLGKPVGNGHPIGVVITTPEIAESFDNGMEFFSTFGGNPVSAAIGLAVLDVLEQERLQDRAAVLGGTLKGSLASLAMRHEMVGDIRGRGLFLGIELVSDRGSRQPAPDIARYVIDRMAHRGVLLGADGPAHNVLKIKPPMPFTEEDGERLVDELDRVLAEDAVLWMAEHAPEDDDA
ncbi:MAG: aminotransferase class III-fold pyridoxal phosphate-dependent enzyme [Gemmatimonadota bacterium]